MKSKTSVSMPKIFQVNLKLLFYVLLFLGIKTFAQSPELNVKGDDAEKVRLSQLIVNVKVVGNIAYTTAEMHFFNSGTRQMEAELIFPLPENVSVSRYAIDINGKLREAVPVNKNKGKQVFEAIEHRRVDPGLLEKVDGNNFRTRIYPLLPNGERIVIIGYEEELSAFDKDNLAYQLVSRYPKKLDKFEINVSVLGASTSPKITEKSGQDISFSKWNQSFQTSLKKENYQPSEKLVFKIPLQQKTPSVVIQDVGSQYYFYGNIFVEGNKIAKKAPNSLGIIWDNSLSCQTRDLQKELDLLEAYFKKIQNTKVSLYFLNYTFEKQREFVISNGNWSELKSILQNTKYDGGTRFSQINLLNDDEYLFFSDGLSSLSENSLPKTKKAIYTVTSSASADFAFLNYSSMQTGGCFINLNQLNTENALDKLVNTNLKFLGIKENFTVTDLFPMEGTSASGSFSFSGISLNPKNEITLLFGYEKGAVLERKISLDAAIQNTNDINIEKLWAQKKIANLDLQYAKNATEIELLGKKYGIITKNTSLIVLEDIRDYISYDITPPAELRPEFDRIKKQEQDTNLAKQKSNWESVESYFAALNSWWKEDKKYVAPKVLPKSKKNKRTAYETIKGDADAALTVDEPVGAGAAVEIMEDNSVYNQVASSPPQVDMVRFVAPTVVEMKDKKVGYEAESAAKSLSGKVEGVAINATSERASSLNYSVSDTIAFNSKNKDKNWNPDRLYLKALASAPKEKQYDLYLELRKAQERNPSFYFDIAHFFYNQGDVKKAVQVLSNIGDLGLENHQLYKTLTYTLRQWQDFDDALFTAKQVAKWRAHEPQSLRDYALALEDAGNYQEAFDQLIKALEVNYYGEMSGQYEGVEDIILMDINRLVTEYKGLNTDKLDKKYLEKMPVDMRVIMNWNLMDVDLDLHIIEPTGEECYYGHKTTQAGARFSKDFTQGYGPEQYLIRNAVKGKYQIKTNFYGETELTENGPATIMVEIYTTRAGKTARTLKTIQLGKIKENEVLAEIIW
ncbi:VIT domain-containing protein [Flavobacterium pectinovorum]|uniref:VIT domain-containing protein n=1 Tax=Flavobacterium pectinovorum TaxID=29533 RepID=UPI00265FC946|nr:VIT domain-containing protein [Flavobacterium pectinovorum]WKL46240.1 VIT domain-containing protein [Flavobacterium pectinovorum]